MATRYVENYRNNSTATYSDTDTIRRAVGNMADGDTLVFEAGRTYVINHPISLIECVEDMDGEESYYCVTKRHLTIDGNGCTICGSNSFIENYGKEGTNNKNALFYTSDNMKHGMEYCTIKNFHFKWQRPESNKDYDESIRNMGLGVVTSEGSIYFSNGIIENCTFEGFRVGLYQCGDNSIVTGCTFTTCYEGVYSDGSVHNVFENNHFFTTLYKGLHLGSSYDSTARNNKFYKCKSYSIYANGEFESSTNSKDTRITITNNKIYGEGPKDANRTDYGIKLQAVHQVVVSGNIICDIGGNDDVSGYGIYVDGNLNAYNENSTKCDQICVSKEVTVSNNVIYGCCGGGIRVNNSVSVLISDNNIINNPENDPDEGSARSKHGIVIRSSTHGITVSNNTMYQFGDFTEIDVSNNNNTVVVQNNSIIKERFILEDHIINDRIIDNATYQSHNIVLPESISDFYNGEKFRLKIPEEYTKDILFVIAYNGNAYMLHKNNSENPNDDSETINFPTEEKGKYIWIQYRRVGEGYRFFYLHDYIPDLD